MPAQLTQTNPAVIAWAIEESGYDLPGLAEKLEGVGVSESLIEDWLSARTTPTKGQLTRLAKALHRPKALFYGARPPVGKALPANLRVAQGTAQRELLPEERLALRRARRQQQLVARLLPEDDSRIDIPDGSTTQDPLAFADLLRSWSNVSFDDQMEWKSNESAYAAWKAVLEDKRVLVMELSLKRNGLRGFAIYHETAPVVAVNTATNHAARTFTLWHEVAHLSLEAGASCLDPSLDPSSAVERWCDQVASAVLMPPREVLAFLEEHGHLDDFELVREGSKRFCSSLRAMAISIERVSDRHGDLFAFIDQQAQSADYEKRGGGGGGGQPRPVQRLREIGTVAARIVTDAVAADRLSELTARRALRLDGYELDVLASEVADR